MKVWSTGWWRIQRGKGSRFRSFWVPGTMFGWSPWRSWRRGKSQSIEHTTGESSLLREGAVISRSLMWKTSKFLISGYQSKRVSGTLSIMYSIRASFSSLKLAMQYRMRICMENLEVWCENNNVICLINNQQCMLD